LKRIEFQLDNGRQITTDDAFTINYLQ